MFRPTSLAGQAFRKYLLMNSHPAKVRVQNLAGDLFEKGIAIEDEDGVKFTLDANDWITRVMLLEGNYESGSTSLARKILSKGGVFLDVGANFGLYSCIAAGTSKHIQVIAVEPNYKMIPILLNNIRQNGLSNRVKVINAAISDGFQFVTMEQPASNNAGTTVMVARNIGELTVLSSALDFIFSEAEISEAELLKIDIEGNEFDVLKNFPFEKYLIRNIILEFNHLSKISFGALIVFFESKNFTAFTITGEPLLSDREIPENNIWFANDNFTKILL